MIVLDEDLSDPNIAAALGRYPGVCYLSDMVPTGLEDEDVVDRLRGMKDVVFITNNSKDYWYRYNSPRQVCILCLAVETKDAKLIAALVRRVLSLNEFSTHRIRAGLTLRVTLNRVRWYRDRTRQDASECNVIAFEL